MKLLETVVPKNQWLVNIPDVADEQVVIDQSLFEVHWPNLFTDGDDHQAQCWRKRTSNGIVPSLADTAAAQCKRLHIKSRCEKGWHIFDHNLSSDIETSERAALYKIARIVGFSRIGRGYLVVPHIHMWAKKVQQHIPCPYEASLVDAGEEAGQVLVYKDKVAINWSCLKDREECVNISQCKMIRACYWDQLEYHSGQNVEHWSERRVHKGDDGTTALVCFLGQDISCWKLAALANGQRIRSAIVALESGHQRGDDGLGFLINRLKDRSVLNGLNVETSWAEDSKWRGLLIFTVEDGTFKRLLEAIDWRFRDVAGDLLRVLLPQGLN